MRLSVVYGVSIAVHFAVAGAVTSLKKPVGARARGDHRSRGQEGAEAARGGAAAPPPVKKAPPRRVATAQPAAGARAGPRGGARRARAPSPRPPTSA